MIGEIRIRRSFFFVSDFLSSRKGEKNIYVCMFLQLWSNGPIVLLGPSFVHFRFGSGLMMDFGSSYFCNSGFLVWLLLHWFVFWYVWLGPGLWNLMRLSPYYRDWSEQPVTLVCTYFRVRNSLCSSHLLKTCYECKSISLCSIHILLNKASTISQASYFTEQIELHDSCLVRVLLMGYYRIILVHYTSVISIYS